MLQLILLPSAGRKIVKFTGHNAEMLCGWGVKAE